MGESVALSQDPAVLLPGECQAQPDTCSLWFGRGHLQETLCERRQASRASLSGPSLRHLESQTWGGMRGRERGRPLGLHSISRRRATAYGPSRPYSVLVGGGSLQNLVAQDLGSFDGWMPMNPLFVPSQTLCMGP